MTTTHQLQLQNLKIYIYIYIQKKKIQKYTKIQSSTKCSEINLMKRGNKEQL